MTDAKPVAETIDELEREAADVEDISPLAIRGAFERLAALARRLLAERDAAERALADERRSFLLSESTLVQKAERERDALQVALNNVSGALVDSGVTVPDEARYGEAVRGIVGERYEACRQLGLLRQELDMLKGAPK